MALVRRFGHLVDDLDPNDPFNQGGAFGPPGDLERQFSALPSAPASAPAATAFGDPFAGVNFAAEGADAGSAQQLNIAQALMGQGVAQFEAENPGVSEPFDVDDVTATLQQACLTGTCKH